MFVTFLVVDVFLLRYMRICLLVSHFVVSLHRKPMLYCKIN